MTEQPIEPTTGETPTPAATPAAPVRMPSPAALARKAPAPLKPILPVTTPADEAAIEAAKAFGRVDEESGTVYLIAEPEIAVGTVADAAGSDPLTHFATKYLDVVKQLDDLDLVIAATPPQVREVRRGVDKVANVLATPHFVGDLAAVQARAAEQQIAARQIISDVDRARKVEKQHATEERETLVAAAEALAEADGGSLNWRQAGDQFREYLDAWKQQQARDIKLDKPIEDALWKRFSHARSAFDRRRKQHFAELDASHSQAKAVKEKLIADAEKLSTSTDWPETTSKFRSLMDAWRVSGRASRKEDDALWARFKAAQDAFFTAKNEEFSAVESEYQENLVVKEALLAEAQAILPVTDIAAAKNVLRGIQDRWEDAGKVPRNDMRRIEDGLRAIERAIKTAEDEAWQRSNPETQARTAGFTSQLEGIIADLEADLAKAKAAGNAKKIADVEANLAARREWLATLQG